MARYVAAASRVLGPNANVVVGQSIAPGPSHGNSGSPTNGDTTASPVPITSIFSNLKGSILAQPIVWLFALVLFLAAWKLIEEHRGGQEGFSKIRVDGTNLIKSTGMVLLGFIILRFSFTKVSIPGLSPIVLYGVGS